MANETNGGSRTPASRPSDLSVDEIMSYVRSTPSAPVDDSVVDEILRSISEQSSTPVPETSYRAPASASPTITARPTANTAPTGQHTAPANSYEAAAARAQQQAGPAASPASNPAGRPVSSATGPMPDPAYYAMRDPSQTQSFQPARPAHRDTDRIPTIVKEEDAKPKTTAVGKVLTIIVAILVIVALVLGVKMLYILGPSMGLDLPDLTKLPVVSTFVDMLPEEEPIEEQIPEDVVVEEEEVEVVLPTTIALDVEELTLEPGQSVIITAALDVPDWEGDIAWGTNDAAIATVNRIDSRTAEVTYVGEGRCWIAAVVNVTTEDGSSPPSASCSVVCEAASETEIVEEENLPEENLPEETLPEEPVTEEPTDEETAAEHVDIKLNTYRDSGEFSLTVGETHVLVSENADQITLTSSNEAVATVSANGIVTAKGVGTCTITATGPDGTTVEAICRITA